MDQLLRTLNHAFVMVQALMLNTLTRRQIAVLVVSSFPYVPRPAPLMEAAHELLTQRQQQVQQQALAAATGSPGCKDAARDVGGLFSMPATPAAAAAAGGAIADDEVSTHTARRLELLEQQVQRWWFSELQHLQLQEEPGQGSW